jgi:hypothetical protein
MDIGRFGTWALGWLATIDGVFFISLSSEVMHSVIEID